MKILSDISLMMYQPIWVKFLQILPVFGIMMQCFERKKNLCSLGNGRAIAECGGFGTHTGHAVKCTLILVNLICHIGTIMCLTLEQEGRFEELLG